MKIVGLLVEHSNSTLEYYGELLNEDDTYITLGIVEDSNEEYTEGNYSSTIKITKEDIIEWI